MKEGKQQVEHLSVVAYIQFKSLQLSTPETRKASRKPETRKSQKANAPDRTGTQTIFIMHLDS